MAKGQFDLNDLRGQLAPDAADGRPRRRSPAMLPGMKKAQAAMAASGVDDKVLVHLDAIIGSMTPKERSRPELMNAKRKIRVAKGSGTDGAGGQQAAQDAPGNGDRDEEDQKMGGLGKLGALFGGGGGMGGMGGPAGWTAPAGWAASALRRRAGCPASAAARRRSTCRPASKFMKK